VRRATLELLCCPRCRGELLLRDGSEVVEAGSLLCPRCHRDFPVRDGIPRFLRPEELTGLNRRFTRLYDLFSYVYVPVSRLFFAFLGGEAKSRREVVDRLELGRREAPAASPGRAVEAAVGRILEVSIGPGVNLPYLIGAAGAPEVFGLDISLGQLERCRSYCRRRGFAVELFLGMAEELPFRDESFDGVLHVGGINFFSDKAKAIREMVRVARPGANLVIADESEEGARVYERWIPGFSRMFEGKREPVRAPVDLVPPQMEDVRTHTVWRGLGYCVEFRKPATESQR
jgi:uncharacterized protein YbaR (Trm112 family)